MERRSMPDQDRWIVDLSAVRDSDVGGGGGGAFRADRVASAALWNRSSPRGRPPPLHRSRGRLRGCFPRRGSGNDVEEQRRSRRDRARYYQKEHSAWSWPREDTRPFQGKRQSSRIRESAQRVPDESTALVFQRRSDDIRERKEAARISRYSVSWKRIDRGERKGKTLPSLFVLPRGEGSGSRDCRSRNASTVASRAYDRSIFFSTFRIGRVALSRSIVVPSSVDKIDRPYKNTIGGLAKLEMARTRRYSRRFLVDRGSCFQSWTRIGIFIGRKNSDAHLFLPGS